MHDIDRTMLEMEYEAGDFDDGEFELEFDDGEFEYADEEAEWETYDEAFLEPEYEGEYEFEYELEGPFDEAEEMELAADLLEVMDEAELDLFLGKLIKRATKFVKKRVPRSVRRAVGSKLKSLARRALPAAGAALGSFFAPGVGTAVGARLASQAGKMFGLELEGLSPEDQEFEVARRYVRLAGEVAQQAAKAPPTMPPQTAANKAMAIAVRKHAPGLMSGGRGSTSVMAARRPGNRGIWKRRGRSIVLFGVYR